MSTTSAFYLTQATRSEQAAECASLDNVRECHLRSAHAWRTLADRLTRAEIMRAEQAAEKADRRLSAFG